MMKNTTPLTRPLSVLLAASLLLGACASDTADDASDATTSSTTTASTQETATTTAVVSADETVETTAAVSNAAAASGYLGSYTLDDAEFGTQVVVTVDGSTRTIVANALPDHETGDFPNAGNPNTISAQDITYEYTTEPTFTGAQSAPRTTGVAVNGVKFEPGTAETVTCTTGGTFRVEALQDVYNLGLDFNNAHVQPTGEYHYHGASELLADAYSTGDDLVHVGFAADGFLMYYSKSGAYESGYALSTNARSGTDCVGSGPLGGDTVTVEGTSPDGTFTSDWEWSDANGDLDECNGVEIDGEYAYIITNEYPYISRCLNGDAAAESGPGGGAAPDGADGADSAEGAAPEGASEGQGPDLTEAAEALGVTLEELQAALGGPPPDLEAAAETLGITVADLQAVLPAGPNG